MWVYPDISLLFTGVALVATTSRRLTLNYAATGIKGAAGMYTNTGDLEMLQRVDDLHAAELHFHIDDVSLSVVSKRVYEIDRAEPANMTAETSDIWVDPGLAWSTKPSLTGNPTLKWRRYRMPADFQRVLSIRDATDFDELTELTRSRVASLELDLDQTGRPTHFFVKNTRDSHPHMASRSPFLGPNRDIALHAYSNLPPAGTLAGAAVAGGSLGGGTYRVFVSWYYQGRFSPPGNVVEVVVPGGATGINTLRLTGLESMLDANYGRVLTVWISRAEGAFNYLCYVDDSGAFSTLSGTPDPTTTQFDIDATLVLSELNAFNGVRRWDEVYPGGRYTYLSVWPIPDARRRLTLEYLARPGQLLDDKDEPDLPREFHMCLVHRAVMELGSRHEGEQLKKTHAALYKQVLGQMRKAFIGHQRRSPQKGMIDGDGPYGRAIIDSVDWQGP